MVASWGSAELHHNELSFGHVAHGVAHAVGTVIKTLVARAGHPVYPDALWSLTITAAASSPRTQLVATSICSL